MTESNETVSLPPKPDIQLQSLKALPDSAMALWNQPQTEAERADVVEDTVLAVVESVLKRVSKSYLSSIGSLRASKDAARWELQATTARYKEEAEALGRVVTALDEDIASVRAVNESLGADLETLTQWNSDSTTIIEELRTEVDDLCDARCVLDNMLTARDSDIADLTEVQESLRAEAQALRDQLVQWQGEVEKLTMNVTLAEDAKAELDARNVLLERSLGEELGECIICMDSSAIMAIKSCGHLCLCPGE